jgi:hypothetical protein
MTSRLALSVRLQSYPGLVVAFSVHRTDLCFKIDRDSRIRCADLRGLQV